MGAQVRRTCMIVQNNYQNIERHRNMTKVSHNRNSHDSIPQNSFHDAIIDDVPVTSSLGIHGEKLGVDGHAQSIPSP
jgi:hypothetical protein